MANEAGPVWLSLQGQKIDQQQNELFFDAGTRELIVVWRYSLDPMEYENQLKCRHSKELNEKQKGEGRKTGRGATSLVSSDSRIIFSGPVGQAAVNRRLGMRRMRIAAVVLAGVVGMWAGAGRAGENPSVTAKAVSAAKAFLATLDQKQQAAVQYKFSDDRQRARWLNFPTGFVPRGGLSLKQLSEERACGGDAALVGTVPQWSAGCWRRPQPDHGGGRRC